MFLYVFTSFFYAFICRFMALRGMPFNDVATLVFILYTIVYSHSFSAYGEIATPKNALLRQGIPAEACIVA